uniref:WH1 domain-containing protein n=1 Tax=Haemonchus contortus TaxID=6289 RepID=A0A6F7PRG4_HAECO
MGESSMAAAAAEVMIYNENRKQWQAPAGCEGKISSIQVLHNAIRQTFRIIAIREQDGAWVLNCNIHHKLKYHTATPTFHQWRDEQRQVYGLNFSSEKEARDFVSAVGQAIDYLNHQFVHGGEYQVPNENIYQDPHQHIMSHIQSAPSFRDQEDSSASHLQMNSMHPSFRKTSHCVQSNATLSQQQQRRSSQGSSSSSNGPCNMYSQQQTASPSRTAPGPPPAPSVPQVPIPTSNCPPAAPPPPPANAAPPPPPPPPPNLLKSDASRGTSLVDQLRGAQLKKTSAAKEIRSVSIADPSSVSGSNVAGSSHGDLLSELAATFNRKKITQAKADAADSKSNASNGSSDSGCGTIPPVNGFAAPAVGNVSRKWETVKTNGNMDSPKTHRKVPSGSSISSQEELKVNGTPVAGSVITPEFLERFKADLMVEVRLEINKAKEDIIEAFRSELARR